MSQEMTKMFMHKMFPSMKPEGKGGAKKERVEIDFSKVKIKSCVSY